MRALATLRGVLERPVERRKPFLTDLGRLGVFLFGIEVVTGALLALHYRPSPDGAYASLATVNDAVSFGWVVRSLHRVTAHALVAVVGAWSIRAFFRRSFLRPGGRVAWALTLTYAAITVAFLVTGGCLPWNQEAYWNTVVLARLVEVTPLVGHWLASVFRGGEEVGAETVVRLYAIHALLLPWAAFALLTVGASIRRRREALR